MGFIEDTRDFSKSASARLDKLEKTLADLLRNRVVDPQASASASIAGSAWLSLASQEHWALVVIKSGPDSDGYYLARIQEGRPDGTVIDDDELADLIRVCAFGATPFIEAAGLARYCGMFGTPQKPLWVLGWGEWCGFKAKLIGAPDANESYAWQQVDNAPFWTPLTDTSGGSTPLGRAWDYSYRSRDPDIPQSARINFLTDTPFEMRFDPIARRMHFFGRREPDTDLC